jgi:NADH-quinone oxidoreductase subunit L
MLFALGVPAYGAAGDSGFTASLFHLFTHAFFKSLLFLGAGAVIHFVHSNEMQDMGGLRKLMPLTHITFLIACVAIAGIPPFASFFSKEEILMTAWQNNKLVYYIALITSGITAFYMFRLYFSVFWNKMPAHHSHSNDHGEGAWNMKLPLLLLAVAVVTVGFIPFSHYISFNGRGEEISIPISFSIAPVIMAIAGISLAYILYYRENPRPQKIAASLGGLYRAARQKFYFDELYLFVTKKIIFNGIAKPAAWIDKYIVDGSMNWLGSTTTRVSESIKALQSGNVQSYTLYFFGGIIALAAVFIYWLK